MADFNPALSLPIKWSIGEDRFNDDDEAKVLTLTIPVASLDQFIDHLKALSYTKQKQGEVYDFKKKEPILWHPASDYRIDTGSGSKVKNTRDTVKS